MRPLTEKLLTQTRAAMEQCGVSPDCLRMGVRPTVLGQSEPVWEIAPSEGEAKKPFWAHQLPGDHSPPFRGLIEEIGWRQDLSMLPQPVSYGLCGDRELLGCCAAGELYGGQRLLWELGVRGATPALTSWIRDTYEVWGAVR